jgi:uncharacterized protein (TIGR03435 family)
MGMIGRRIPATLAFAAVAAYGQKFEVASIKPADPNAHSSSTDTSTGQFRIENFSLKDCLKWAFEVKDFSLSGPAWLASPRFDIVAKPPAGASRREYPAMLQALLADRFGLVFHRETKVLPAYELVVDKKGLRAKPAPESERQGETWGNGLVEGRHETMDGFADLLSRHLQLPVEDRTGVAGPYDIKLTYIPDDARPTVRPEDPSAASSIFAALQEQAGLRLEKTRLPVQILVIDRIERQPTEN